MIYHRGRHRGIVTVNGVQVYAVHCDDVMGYAVVLSRNENGQFVVDRLSNRAKREVVRGNVVFTPKRTGSIVPHYPQCAR